ncbi:uncharacterized protein isoform X2 [Choristoneura fumiferana]|uniref:uncharacterized protein isoform X2 n=1 Tax=Choristoneura fumiferana TaxID=7141 RepID=UPI003D15E501
MNLTEEISPEWKPSPNICQCCLADGCYKDISSEYYFSGENEVYEEILKETLNIQLPHHDGVRRLICEDCITRLRGCQAFKQTILKSMATLNHYVRLQNDDMQLEEVKTEPLQLDVECGSQCADDYPDDASLDDDEILADIKLELTKMEDVQLENDHSKQLTRIKRRSRKELKRRMTL